MLPGGHSLKISCLRFTPENISKLSPFLAGKPFLPNNLMVVSYHFPSWQESLRHQGWWMQTCRQHRSPQPEREKKGYDDYSFVWIFCGKTHHTRDSTISYIYIIISTVKLIHERVSLLRQDRTERNYTGISRNPANSWQLTTHTVCPCTNRPFPL